MPNLKHIKSRMNNVATAEKVSFSMKNISSAKLVQSRKLLNASKQYLWVNNKILKYMLLAYEASEIINQQSYVNNFFNNNPKLPKLLVVMGADRGLCGGFNSSVIKLAENTIKQLEAQNQNYIILPIGNKIKSYFKNHYPDKINSFDQKFEIKTFNMKQALLFVQYIFDLFQKGSVGSLSFIYTEFTSIIHNYAGLKNIFPVDFNSIIAENTEDIKELNVVTDPFIADVINNIIKDIILSSVYKLVIESLTCEHAARVNAMDNSYNNAGDLLKELSLEYNRTRQALITKELIEIISGTESL